jgi:hypothetical protein
MASGKEWTRRLREVESMLLAMEARGEVERVRDALGNSVLSADARSLWKRSCRSLSARNKDATRQKSPIDFNALRIVHRILNPAII